MLPQSLKGSWPLRWPRRNRFPGQTNACARFPMPLSGMFYLWAGSHADRLRDVLIWPASSTLTDQTITPVLAPTHHRYLESNSPVPFAAVGRGRVDLDTLEESDLDYASDEAGLARLRARCKAAIAHFVGCRGEYIVNVRRAIHLGAVCKSRALGVYLPPDGAARWPTRFWWYYVCLLRPWVLRLQATVALAASAAVVWSEVTIGSGRDPDLSPFSLAVHALSTQREFLEQLVVALPLVYMCVCTYFSLFKLGNFGFYHMVRRGGLFGELSYALVMDPHASPICHFPPSLPACAPGASGDVVLLPAAERQPPGPVCRAAVLQLSARHPHERVPPRRPADGVHPEDGERVQGRPHPGTKFQHVVPHRAGLLGPGAHLQPVGELRLQVFHSTDCQIQCGAWLV